MISTGELIYQKPAYLCKAPETVLPGVVAMGAEEIGRVMRERSSTYLQSLGLTLRYVTPGDILAIENFILLRYKSEQATEISPYDLYRFIEFGHGLLLENEQKEVKGCLFGVRYDTAFKESYTVRLGIDESLSGLDTGYHLIISSCLHAMQHGARTKTGIIDFDNHTNLYINLNKIGWICHDFDGYIKALGSCFKVMLPLTPAGLTTNVIDLDKVTDFIAGSKAGRDYRLIAHTALDEMHQMYRDTSFKVVAIQKEEKNRDLLYFLAIPAEELQLNARLE